MEKEVNLQRKKIHPHKFTLWVALASIIMMFAGLTSAYIVKRNQPNWQVFDLPRVFAYSTGVILLSSLTLQVAIRYFKQREMAGYRRFMLASLLLGLLFVVLQVNGFRQMQQMGLTLDGNVAGSFIYVIAGLHALHVLGGVVALLILFGRGYFSRTKMYGSIPLEVAGTYWHFVDILWVYLYVFFLLMR